MAETARFVQSHARVPGSPGDARATQLLERERELETITTILDRVRHEGATIVLTGARGAGKTSVVHWALAAAAERRMRPMAACGTESGRDSAFGVVRQLLDRSVRVGITSRPWCLDPSHATLRALHRILVELAEVAPLAMAIDDAHRMDAASLRFLRFLSRRARDLPMVLLLASTATDAARVADLASIGRGAEAALHLDPLSPRAASALIMARGWPDPHGDLAQACHGATAGNPFLLDALFEHLGDGAGAGPPRAGPVNGVAPPAVLEMVRARLAELPRAAPPLARAVSVLGDGVALRIAAALAAIDETVAADAADELMRDGILRSEAPLAFAQPVVRSAIYLDMSPSARRHAHARAARLLRAAHAPAEHIASHIVATDPIGEPWALDALRQAAQDAARLGRIECASALLRGALDQPLDCTQRIAVLRELGVVETRRSLPGAIERLRQALGLLREHDRGTAEERVSLARLVANAQLMAGQEKEAIGSLDDAIAELDDEHRDLWAVLEVERAAAAELNADHAPATRARLDRLVREPSAWAAPSGQRHLLALLAHQGLERSTRGHEVAELAIRAVSGAGLLGEELGSVPLFLAGTALDLAGRSLEAERAFGQLIERGSLAGSPVVDALAHAGRAVARLHQGRLEGALADARDALDASSRSGGELIVDQLALACWAWVTVEQGRVEDCADELERRWPAGELPNTVFANQLMIARAVLHLAQGRPRAALSELDRLAHRLEAWGAPIQFEWRNPAALVHRELGDAGRALTLAQESLRHALAWGAPRQLGAALRTVGLVEGGTRAVSRFRQAIEVLEESEARLEYARALVDLGAALCRTGHPSQGRRSLHTGLKLATECGATALAHAAKAQLARAGVPAPEHPANARAGFLTQRERGVAQLAAGGLSNPEIAGVLVISRKTVELHLGNAYRKLGIGTRSRLAAALERYP
jgi:DNA-binding CsgD family transcriptional regulator